MGRNFLLVLMLLAACSQMYGEEKKEKKKKKKERKEYVWEMPKKLSGIKDFDIYLKMCDTTYNDLANVEKTVRAFRIDTAYTKPDSLGKSYMLLSVVDQEGNKKNLSTTIMQYIEIPLHLTNISLSMANITLQTAVATLSLSENPLAAFTHAKYLKAGPKIVQLGGQKLGEIFKLVKTQMAAMKSIKDNAIDVGDITSTDQVVINEVQGGIIPDGSEMVDLDSFDMGSNEGAVEVDEEKINDVMNKEIEVSET